MSTPHEAAARYFAAPGHRAAGAVVTLYMFWSIDVLDVLGSAPRTATGATQPLDIAA